MSKIEVDAIEPQSGTTLTIGASGDSVNIASGATITDFTSTGIDDNATSTAITIDSSENVGIGTTSPTPPTAYGGLHINSQYPVLKLSSTTSGTGVADGFTVRINSTDDAQLWHYENKNMSFATNNAERMRITSAGDVGIGTTTPSLKLEVLGSTKSNNITSRTSLQDIEPTPVDANSYELGAGYLNLYRDDTVTVKQVLFGKNGVEVGSISTTGAATAYNTSSDYRLKENVNYNFDATTRLKQLKPARFNFIRDVDKTVDGFLAHEVQSVIPEAITGIKDQTVTKEKVVVNADGNVIAENIEQADWEAGKIAEEGIERRW
jgi:hypothetical protein